MTDFTVVDSEENHKLRNELQVKTLELARAKELLSLVYSSPIPGLKLRADIFNFIRSKE